MPAVLVPMHRALELNITFATNAGEEESVQIGCIHRLQDVLGHATVPKVTTFTQYQQCVPILEDLPGVTHFELRKIAQPADGYLEVWNTRFRALTEDIRAHG